FSGDLVGGKWQIKANPGDVIQNRNHEPILEEYADYLKHAQDTLKNNTGYSLRARPSALKNIRGPSKVYDRFEIKRIIEKAVDDKEIGDVYDTGFDIDPKSYVRPKK